MVEQHDVVGDERGVVQVVEDDAERGAVLVGQLADQVERLDLVAEVEVVGRLVEQEDAGVLGEAGGQPDPLELAAGQLVDGAVGHGRDPGEGHGPVDGRPVGVVERREPAAVRVAAEGHDVADGEAGGVRAGTARAA